MYGMYVCVWNGNGEIDSDACGALQSSPGWSLSTILFARISIYNLRRHHSTLKGVMEEENRLLRPIC